MKTDIASQTKILAFFIIIIFIGLVFVALKMSEENIPKNYISKERIIELLGTPFPAPEAGSAGGKFLNATKYYKNGKYGFELEYPAGWIIDSGNSADIFIQPRLEEKSDLPIPHEGALEIKTSLVVGKAVLSDLVLKYKEDGVSFIEEKTEVGGVPGSKITTNICRAENCRITEWFVLKDNYLYQISSIYPDIKYNAQFDEIISSIKFLENAE